MIPPDPIPADILAYSKNDFVKFLELLVTRWERGGKVNWAYIKVMKANIRLLRRFMGDDQYRYGWTEALRLLDELRHANAMIADPILKNTPMAQTAQAHLEQEIATPPEQVAKRFNFARALDYGGMADG